MVAIQLDLERFEHNYRKIQEEVAGLATGAGHSAPEIIVVSKYLDVADTTRLLDAGVAPLGENRVDSLIEKTTAVDQQRGGVAVPDQWHFIGHVQRNKVARLIGRFGLLHSLDSRRLAAAVAKASSPPERCRCLVQVNVSGEESKGGLALSAGVNAVADEVADWITAFPQLQIVGLMTMAPQLSAAECRPHFARLRECLGQIQATLPAPDAAHFRELSMGMSNDYREAVQEGATLIRLGRVLYQ